MAAVATPGVIVKPGHGDQQPQVNVGTVYVKSNNKKTEMESDGSNTISSRIDSDYNKSRSQKILDKVLPKNKNKDLDTAFQQEKKGNYTAAYDIYSTMAKGNNIDSAIAYSRLSDINILKNNYKLANENITNSNKVLRVLLGQKNINSSDRDLIETLIKINENNAFRIRSALKEAVITK